MHNDPVSNPAGTAGQPNITGNAGPYVVGDAANDRAQIQTASGSSGFAEYYFTFTYQIL